LRVTKKLPIHKSKAGQQRKSLPIRLLSKIKMEMKKKSSSIEMMELDQKPLLKALLNLSLLLRKKLEQQLLETPVKSQMVQHVSC